MSDFHTGGLSDSFVFCGFVSFSGFSLAVSSVVSFDIACCGVSLDAVSFPSFLLLSSLTANPVIVVLFKLHDVITSNAIIEIKQIKEFF